MTTRHLFSIGEAVLFVRNGSAAVGTVYDVARSIVGGFVVQTPDGVRRVAPSRMLEPLPAGTPVYGPGVEVRVRSDAPDYAGQTGLVSAPELRDQMFGYWIFLGPSRRVWIPAGALTPAGGVR